MSWRIVVRHAVAISPFAASLGSNVSSEIFSSLRPSSIYSALFFLSVGGRRDGQFIQQEDGHSSEEILPSVFPQYTTHYPYRLLCELSLIWLVQSCFLFPCVVLCCSHPGKQMTMAVGGTSQPLVKNLNKNVKAKEVKKTRTRQRQKLKESRKERNI